jgi:NADH-quinone oxidoreductase subunit J
MSLPVALFALLALATAGSALGVVVSRSVVRAAVWLLFTLIGVSLLYFLLGAEFLGAAQLIVYVGGTLVLVVFGVMLTSQGPFEGFRPKAAEWVAGGALAAGLFALIVSASLELGQRPTPPVEQTMPGTGQIGMSFLGVPETATGTAFLLPFEIVSVHLLVVLIAAAYLARAKRRAEPGVKP